MEKKTKQKPVTTTKNANHKIFNPFKTAALAILKETS